MYIIIKYEYIHNDEQLYETYIIEDLTEKNNNIKNKTTIK